METYKKRTRLNKVKQFTEKLLIDAFVIIGMLAVLSWSIGVFKEAGSFYFSTKKVVFSTERRVEATSLVKTNLDIVSQETKEDGGITTPSLQKIVDGIYRMESSNGKNNYSKCEAIGKFNGFGYGIYDNNYLCFEKGEDRKVVEKWVDDNLKNGLTEKELLCKYNTGSTNDCEYYEKYKQL